MEKDALKQIIEKHAIWLEDAEDGERADLIGADLIDADLRGADLRHADLSDANLTGAVGYTKEETK